MSEIFFNPFGIDQGKEFVELAASPGESGDQVWLLVVGGTGGSVGVVLNALSLQGRQAGSNGLFLIRDSSAVLAPAPHAGTSIMIEDFGPDLPNVACTFALVTGFGGWTGQDLDTNDDGILDVRPWTAAVHAFGVPNGSSSFDRTYGPALSGVDFSLGATFVRQAVTPASTGEPVVTSVRTDNPAWGPYTLQQGAGSFASGAPYTPTVGQTLTPGNAEESGEISFGPAGYAVASGVPLAGSLASLLASDNLRLLVVCDENEAEGRIDAWATSPALSPATLSWVMEHVAVRDDLLVFLEAKRASDGAFVEVGFSISGFTDQTLVADAQTPSDYIGPQGQVALRVTWIPSADLDSGDGWSVGLDVVAWRIRA